MAAASEAAEDTDSQAMAGGAEGVEKTSRASLSEAPGPSEPVTGAVCPGWIGTVSWKGPAAVGEGSAVTGGGSAAPSALSAKGSSGADGAAGVSGEAVGSGKAAGAGDATGRGEAAGLAGATGSGEAAEAAGTERTVPKIGESRTSASPEEAGGSGVLGRG